MWHSSFIALHAVAGVAAFALGCLALRRGRLHPAYVAALVAMAAFLLLAVGVGWGGNDGVTRIIFSGLAGLAAFMVARGVLAGRVRPSGLAGPSAAYVGHIGFTLVGLADGFAVVTVLRLGAPGWALAATGVAIAIAGHLLLGATRTRMVAITRRDTHVVHQ